MTPRPIPKADLRVGAERALEMIAAEASSDWELAMRHGFIWPWVSAFGRACRCWHRDIHGLGEPRRQTGDSADEFGGSGRH